MKLPTLVYANGCSYTDANWHPSLHDQSYAHAVADAINGFAINNARAGSSNRRIIRTSVHDLMRLRNENPDQKIIALIQITYDNRGEVWVEESCNDRPEAESNFYTHAWNHDDWCLDTNPTTPNAMTMKYFRHLTQGRRYFYNSYAERINLYLDLIMLKSWMITHDIEFRIFGSVLLKPLDAEHLLDTLQQEITDDRIASMTEFGWIDWADQQGFEPLYPREEQRWQAHYGADAHREFAHSVLVPWLKSGVLPAR